MSERLHLLYNEMPTKIFPAQFEYLDAIREFAAAAARQAGLDDKDLYNFQLAVDEAASNIIEHAYEGIPDGQVEISLDVTSTAITIVMRDSGKRFDPDQTSVPDLDAALEDRMVGGLGLFFMRKLMDEVRFEWLPGQGNLLTMVKVLPQELKVVKKNKAGYSDLFDLGEHILTAASFASQRDLIVETALRLVEGQITIWLNEPAFRLPDWVESHFPPAPITRTQLRAYDTGKIIRKHKDGAYYLAIPFRHDETSLGVIEIIRPDVHNFSTRELELLKGLARIASVALIAWQRVNIERWRLEQLNLVRIVSAQIANEPDIDELAHKVTKLIQLTFKYYYVGIFTLEPGQKKMTFRSSTGGSKKHQDQAGELVFQVELGQGLVGYVAETGQELLANDISSEKRFREIGRAHV